jgi:maltooligosyltrehalose trehalohydrolase
VCSSAAASPCGGGGPARLRHRRPHREGRRDELSAFGWESDGGPDPQDPATFERSRLDWTEIGQERHADLLAWYRRLIALRQRTPALTDPRLDHVQTECDPDGGWLVVRRSPVVVAANLGDSEWPCPAGLGAVLLAVSDHRVGRTDRGLMLPPDTVAVLADGTQADGTQAGRAQAAGVHQQG